MNNKKRPKVIFILIFILILLFFGFIYFWYFNKDYSEELVVIKDLNIDWVEKKQTEGLSLVDVKKLENFNIEGYKYYHIANIWGEKYDGWELIIAGAPCKDASMCLRAPYFTGVKKEDTFVVLKNHSTVLDVDIEKNNFFVESVEIDYDYVFKELEYPEKIVGPSERAVLHKIGRVFGDNNKLDQSKFKEIFFHDEYGQAYTDSHHGIYFKAIDGTIVVYNLYIDFFDEIFVLNPIIDWYDGDTDITGYRSSDFHSVFIMSYYLDVIEDIKADELYIIGVNNKGDNIYFPIDPNHLILENVYREMGGFSPSTGQEVSYEEFLSGKPIFLWFDPLGRLVKFTSVKFISHAEMGKPVIYLYPQKEQKVSVKVSPIGGITLSKPEHKDGWNVIAKPTGELIDIKSNKIYPYLFWESKGELYKQPKNGFVVEQKNVSEFLTDKLYSYNLNNKEVSDFLEFWLPLMNDYPYYFITFLGTESMNKLAPMKVTPEPDTIIRVLMDFSPLNEPMEVEALEMIFPEREGFTLIEWGGIIRP